MIVKYLEANIESNGNQQAEVQAIIKATDHSRSLVIRLRDII